MAVTPKQAGRALQRAISESIDSAMTETAEQIQRKAKRRAPVDTGRLRKGTSAKAFSPRELGQKFVHRIYAGFRRVSGRSTWYGVLHNTRTRFLSDPFETEADRLPERLDREFTKRARKLPDIRLN